MNPMSVLRSFVVTAVAFVVLVAPAVVLADGRVALVVGNSTYAHIGRLPNPENDAADMAAALRRLGFEVTTEYDADRGRADRGPTGVHAPERGGRRRGGCSAEPKYGTQGGCGMQSEVQVKAHIAMKAAEDDDFRARLIAAPKATVEEEIGLRFPDGYRIHVHEESATDGHMVLPPKPELSREQLERIAAGHGPPAPNW